MMRLLALALCLFVLSPAYAADEDKTPKISPWLYKKLTQTEKLIAKKSYPKAEQKLQAILADVKDKSYEQATVLRSLSSVYALKAQYKKSAATLSKAINLGVLPKAQMQQAILSLGQLYMATEQYSQAIQTLEPWLAKNSTADPQINVLVANAYAQLKKYRKALPYIKKAIKTAKKPEESWYQLNLALYYELENYPAAAKILTTLIRLYPDKKDYWGQLASIYQQTKQYQKAVSVKHLAYKKGFISNEKDILALANLFLYVGTPYNAAKLLALEIDQKRIKSNSKNWESLAQAWRTAKEFEYAIKALETASKLNDKGHLYQQLGQIYVAQEKWTAAITALNKAISKGGLKNAGATYLLLGMSYYEQNNLSNAKRAFSKAAQFSKHKKTAMQWLDYIKESK
ncbi:MAG: tetratricopeptide repeat protein [Methylococcales bacterium]|nr:tetratricopeptide repeat protein [Methylococcales bacterium]